MDVYEKGNAASHIISLTTSGDDAVRVMHQVLGGEVSEGSDGCVPILGDARARVYPALGTAAATLADAQVSALRASRAVRDIQPNERRYAGRVEMRPIRTGWLKSTDTSWRLSGTHAWSLLKLGLRYGYAGTGSEVRVAVIDTGLEQGHVDILSSSVIDRKNFINPAAPNDVTDRWGHGTMCCGLIAAVANPRAGIRYSVSPSAKLLVAKALDDTGEGDDDTILAGIAWAVERHAKVINLSLGSSRPVNAPFAERYENAVNKLNRSGVVVVAAAGDAGAGTAVENPAACPSIMAVAAVDELYRVASFGPATLDGIGAIDLCAPGVLVPGSALMSSASSGCALFDGTSVSCALTSGVAALYREVYPDDTAAELWRRMVDGCGARNGFSARRVGRGIVQVPR